MDIIAALKEEESRLHRQLNAVQRAIVALNGNTNKASVTSRQKAQSKWHERQENDVCGCSSQNF
jgi:hypothetical protein